MSDSGSSTFDNLLAGSQKNLVTRPATYRLGEVVSRGALLGRLTATGKYQEAQFSNIANYNGYGVATETVDSTSGEVLSDVFVEGEFAENAMTFFYGDDAGTWREKLASVGIYLRKSISVAGI